MANLPYAKAVLESALREREAQLKDAARKVTEVTRLLADEDAAHTRLYESVEQMRSALRTLSKALGPRAHQ